MNVLTPRNTCIALSYHHNNNATMFQFSIAEVKVVHENMYDFKITIKDESSMDTWKTGLYYIHQTAYISS